MPGRRSETTTIIRRFRTMRQMLGSTGTYEGRAVEAQHLEGQVPSELRFVRGNLAPTEDDPYIAIEEVCQAADWARENGWAAHGEPAPSVKEELRICHARLDRIRRQLTGLGNSAVSAANCDRAKEFCTDLMALFAGILRTAPCSGKTDCPREHDGACRLATAEELADPEVDSLK